MKLLKQILLWICCWIDGHQPKELEETEKSVYFKCACCGRITEGTTPKIIDDFLRKDCNHISGAIAASLAMKSPWLDVVEGPNKPKNPKKRKSRSIRRKPRRQSKHPKHPKLLAKDRKRGSSTRQVRNRPKSKRKTSHS